MNKYNKQELEEMKILLERFKKSSDIVIPNDFYRNNEITNKNKNKIILS